MQEWLDKAATLLHETRSGVEIENHKGCIRELEEILAQVESFTTSAEEIETLDPMLVDFVEPAVLKQLGKKIKSMQQMKEKTIHQVEAYREVLQRYFHYSISVSKLFDSVFGKPRYLIGLCNLYIFPGVVFYGAPFNVQRRCWLNGWMIWNARYPNSKQQKLLVYKRQRIRVKDKRWANVS